MIAWMTLCPSPPHVSFENGHAKLGLTQPSLSLAVGHHWEQRLIAPIFVTSPCHSRLPITTSPIQIKKVTWNSFICELRLSVIHLVPKTNPITSQIVDQTLFRFGVYLVIRKISQLLCHLTDGGGLFLICTLCNKSHDTHLDEPWGFMCTWIGHCQTWNKLSNYSSFVIMKMVGT
jgi:hypothetical protein